MKMVTRMVA